MYFSIKKLIIMKIKLIGACLFLFSAFISGNNLPTSEKTKLGDQSIIVPAGIVLENQKMQAVFSKENGALLFLLNKGTVNK